MSTATNRRTLLKAAAMSAAVAALRPGLLHAGEPATDLPSLTWAKAPCRFCGTGCHVQVGVEAGRVVAIAGDREAEVNKGLLCVKGYHVGMVLYGKDRLTQPLLRRGDQHVPISWDEAIDVIARRIVRAPERFAFYVRKDASDQRS